jgi:hypothetical protein
MMKGQEQSDSCVPPRKSSNKAGQPVAEGMEGRELANGNSRQPTILRTQGWCALRAANRRCMFIGGSRGGAAVARVSRGRSARGEGGVACTC